jgi:hypothetical protein
MVSNRSKARLEKGTLYMGNDSVIEFILPKNLAGIFRIYVIIYPQKPFERYCQSCTEFSPPKVEFVKKDG